MAYRWLLVWYYVLSKSEKVRRGESRKRRVGECRIYCWQQFILIMGNQKSQQKKEFEIEINHPRFSKSKIVSEGEEKRLQTSLGIDEKEFDKWKLSSSKYSSPPSNLLLPIKAEFKRTAMCGNTGTATLDYPNYPYLLTEQIYNRRGKKSRFTEVEIWFLLWGLAKARLQAQTAGEQLGDVRPRNIFLNEDGDIKVSNSLSWPLEISNVQKAMDKIPTYLPPEDLERISRNELFQSSSQVGEAFSIGLSVLSAGNLADYEDLYDLKSNTFDVLRFNEALSLWRNNHTYSEVLRGTVSGLCQLDIPRRLTTGELTFLLDKHHQSVEQKVNFLIDNAPQKLHEEIMHSRQLMQPVLQHPLPPVQQHVYPKPVVKVQAVQEKQVSPPSQIQPVSPKKVEVPSELNPNPSVVEAAEVKKQ